MENMPNKVFMRRGEVLELFGISKHALQKVVEAGVLRPAIVPGMSYGMFVTKEVERVFEGIIRRELSNDTRVVEKKRKAKGKRRR